MMLSLKRLQFLYQFVDFQLNSMLFNHCKLNIQIDNPHNRDDGLLGDYCDGEEFQAHPLFSEDRYVWFYSLSYTTEYWTVYLSQF